MEGFAPVKKLIMNPIGIYFDNAMSKKNKNK